MPAGSSEPGIGRGARPESDAPRVVVLVRHGCHLCEDAVSAISAICSDLNVSWQAVDVDADPSLGVHSDHVPVTFVGGVQFSIWFLDPDALRAALS